VRAGAAVCDASNDDRYGPFDRDSTKIINRSLLVLNRLKSRSHQLLRVRKLFCFPRRAQSEIVSLSRPPCPHAVDVEELKLHTVDRPRPTTALLLS
jgi:hypothetical protein